MTLRRIVWYTPGCRVSAKTRLPVSHLDRTVARLLTAQEKPPRSGRFFIFARKLSIRILIFQRFRPSSRLASGEDRINHQAIGSVGNSCTVRSICNSRSSIVCAETPHNPCLCTSESLCVRPSDGPCTRSRSSCRKRISDRFPPHEAFLNPFSSAYSQNLRLCRLCFVRHRIIPLALSEAFSAFLMGSEFF